MSKITSNDKTDGSKSPENSKTAFSLPDAESTNCGSGTNLADLERFRLPQNFAAATTRKLLTTVPVRKPSKEAFFQTHPDPSFRLRTMLLELKEGGHEVYLILPELWEPLVGEPTVAPKVLIPAVTRQGTMTLWPIRMPRENGRIDDWNASAIDAAEIGKTKWIRLVSDQTLGAYEVHEALDQSGEPKWPDESFPEIVNIAFKNRIIDSLDHPILRRLRGEF